MVDADVGPAEPVDGLLGIADDEERARTDAATLVRGEVEEKVGLQRIGVLDLVGADVAEAVLVVAADLRAVADEGAGLDQQVEESSAPAFCLRRS